MRNHPALRQRITMIAQPTRQRPFLQALFAIAFGLMTCCAFTTSRAAEREGAVTAKEDPATTKAESEPRQTPAVRDGDGAKKTGPRDGDRPKSAEADGVRNKPEADRDGAKAAVKTPGSGKALTVKIVQRGRFVVVDGEKVPAGNLRGYLQKFLAGKDIAEVALINDKNVTPETLNEVRDAIRDNGLKNVTVVDP